MRKYLLLILVLLLISCSEEVKEIPDEVYDLREIGVNVIGIDNGYDTVVLYEPIGDEQDMILDVGIIAGYMYQLHTFGDLTIVVEEDEEEVFSIVIDYDDIEDYEEDKINVEEFVSRWEFI